ncbi:hypothetical protein M0638_14740 [Roseomonas sp. NAR14]|uniref:Uncharacterized protein n=1 Tax=Roseomonas acroporae TaxID=2937791 RepID=A0A9X1YG62_9PROT|nr:hypothetical protein [Roseomonas acroporae]MCK8785641.1 hypothetical protein [Roseomonas acroporae]
MPFSSIRPLLALLTLLAAPAARAGEPGGALQVTAALGGSVPYLTGEGMFMVARLDGIALPSLSLDRRRPFPENTRTVFDQRTEAVLGVDCRLGRIGLATLSLDGLLSVAERAAPEQARPLLALVLLRLGF